jgi:hypothetical protein
MAAGLLAQDLSAFQRDGFHVARGLCAPVSGQLCARLTYLVSRPFVSANDARSSPCAGWLDLAKRRSLRATDQAGIPQRTS